MKKYNFTYQFIKYIVILFFIYSILYYFNFFNVLDTAIMKRLSNSIQNNSIYKSNKIEELCPIKIFNPENKFTFVELETIPTPDISNSKTQLNNPSNKLYYCSFNATNPNNPNNPNNSTITIHSNNESMLGAIYLDLEKCNTQLP
jgi:hypothetical protein